VSDRQLALEFRSEPDAAPIARSAAALAVKEWGLGHLADDTALVVSELVTNGMLHAGAPVKLRLRATEDGVRIEVEDRSRIAPVRPIATLDSMTGRGIALVEALARRWGVQQLADGKVVWCELHPSSYDDEPDVDVDALLAAWSDDTGAEPLYTVELGDVPTDLLVAAKAHIDNLIREFTLAAAGDISGSTGKVPMELAQLIDTVVHRFAEARQAIKRQAIAAAMRGEQRTHLQVSLTLSAVEAGEEYLAALDLADSYARDARLLTLETPPAHRVFRHWYVGALVDQVRGAASGAVLGKPQTFEERLLEELATVAAAQRASARSARLQAVTSQLANASTAEEIASVVVSEGAAVLGASGGAVMLHDQSDALAVPSTVGYSADIVDRLQGQAAGADLPAATAIRTREPIWLESRVELMREFPGMGSVEPQTVAMCAVPLTTPGRVRGALRFSFDHTRLFDADERSFITALAAQTAQALERSDLYDAERRARADAEDIALRLARLQQVTTALTGARDPEGIAEIVVTHAADALGAGVTSFSVLTDDVLRIVGSRGVDPATAERFRTFPLDGPLPASEAVRRNEVVVVATRQELVERYPALADVSDRERSLVCVPVSLGEQRLGVISLSFPSDHVFDTSQLRFLTAVADTCAQALDRARALDRATVATEKLAFLARASSELGRSLDHRETLARLTRLVVPRLADWCAVQVVEEGQLVTLAVAHADPDKVAMAEALQAQYPPRLDAPSGVANVIRTGVSELHPSITEEQLLAAARDERHLGLLRELAASSALVVPLTGRHGTFGALTLIAADSGRHFDADDLAFAEDVAARAAVAVENAQAYQQQSGQLAAITRIAEAAQQAILAPVPPRMGSLRLAASYASAAQDARVGGDLYEAIRLPGSVRLLIGDVRGKGLDAVRMATVVLGHFRSAAVECADLHVLATQVDDRLRRYLGDEDFVTALMAEVYDDGRCEVVACGHPPALLAQDGRLTPIGAADSLPLGLGAAPQPVTVQLTKGSRLLLYTDGILEARDPTGEFVHLTELAAPLLQVPELAAALDGVLAALNSAVGGHLGDDLALLVAEYDPPVSEGPGRRSTA
jgi:GAF domain-containing protein/anti-sigma regulatory factor (Ser/Thr protein kinase)